jgi:hypothetical protein
VQIEVDEFASLLKAHSNANVAADLARKGVPVFPVHVCEQNGKLSPIANWPQKASVDLQVVASWWRKNPEACVAIPTGERSGLAVLDLDVKNGKNGVAALAELGIPEIEALSPVRVSTPNGGWHLYFRADPRLRTTADRIGRGIDVRAEGGFVFAPGTMRGTGRYSIEGL